MEQNPAVLKGERTCIKRFDTAYPFALECISSPPEHLYVIGNVEALQEGLAVIGSRKATPYGLGCAKRFATQAAERGIVIISGGARGCDSVAHEAALAVGTPTVAFLGGGCDQLYPRENFRLFQRIVDAGGAVVSEYSWDEPPLPYLFPRRNRLIAGLSKALLVVEANIRSGTLSSVDHALSAGRDVLVVPGAITSAQSHGANRLICQGAHPVVDDESFNYYLYEIFGCVQQGMDEQLSGDIKSFGRQVGRCARRLEAKRARDAETPGQERPQMRRETKVVQPTLSSGSNTKVNQTSEFSSPLLEAICAEPLGLEQLRILAEEYFGEDHLTRLMVWLAKAEAAKMIAQYPDGRYGPST